MTDAIVCCDDLSSQAVSPPLTDSEIKEFIDALKADRGLTRADLEIATQLIELARNTGYVDCAIIQIAQLGSVSPQTAITVRRRLVERGFFRVEKGSQRKPNRFFPLKPLPPTDTRRRTRVTL